MMAAQLVEVCSISAIQCLPSSNYVYDLLTPFQYNKPYKIHQIPTPSSLGPHDLLLKVVCASICHTEQLVSAGVFSTKLPCVASHEPTGIIAAVGSSQTLEWKPGDRVLAGIRRNRCGECPDCIGPEEYSNYCPYSYGDCGVTCDGAFAEYMVIDGREAARLPDSIPFETAAPLACAGKTIYRGLVLCRESTQEKNPWIALVGSGGGLGHLGCQMAKAMGMRVIGIDARDPALELTRESGADVVIDARAGTDEVVKQVAAAVGDKGKFSGVEAAIALADPGTPLACAVTRMHGTMVQIAQPTNVEIPFAELVFRDIRIRGSLLCSRQQARDMLDLVAKHGIKARIKTFKGLESIPTCVEEGHKGLVGKGVIIVDEELVTKQTAQQ